MRIGRTIPPAVSPIYLRDILNGMRAIIHGSQEVDRFRLELKAYLGVRHCFLVSSGKAALTVILKALHSMYPDRDEVLVPAFCCYSVPSAIVRAGLKIRLCDVDPDTLDFDFGQLEKTINANDMNGSDVCYATQRLLAVISVNLFGLAADVDRVRRLAGDSSISIIEDSAQAFEVESKGRRLGTRGDIGVFSLGRSKPISAVEGGIIVTDKDDIAELIKSVMDETPHYAPLESLEVLLKALALTLFQNPNLFWFPKMLPFLKVGETIYDPKFKIRRMSEIQAGIVKNWESKLSAFESVRKKTAKQWKKVLKTSEVIMYSSKSGEEPHYIRFPVRIKKTELWLQIIIQSETHGSGIMLTYPDSINNIPELRDQFVDLNLPAARSLAREMLTIPVHPLLTVRDKRKIYSLVSMIGQKIDKP